MHIVEVLSFGDWVGSGLSSAFDCTVRGIGKADSTDSPYAVANEFICGRLAMLAGLPVAPGALVRSEAGLLVYVSLRLAGRQERPPPVDPLEVVSDHELVAGQVVGFDCWIANPDRHEGNLAYSRPLNIPLTIFDHDRALLGVDLGEAPTHLKQDIERPVFDNACLAPLIPNEAGYKRVTERIQNLQRSGMLQETIEQAISMGLLSPELGALVEDFLSKRATNLGNLLREAPAPRQKVLL